MKEKTNHYFFYQFSNIWLGASTKSLSTFVPPRDEISVRLQILCITQERQKNTNFVVFNIVTRLFAHLPPPHSFSLGELFGNAHQICFGKNSKIVFFRKFFFFFFLFLKSEFCNKSKNLEGK
jgi:hypothetical protein